MKFVKNMKENNKFNFTYYLYLLVGFSFILYIIYIRIIVVRLPRELFFFVNGTINVKVIILVSMGVFVSLSILWINIKLFFNNQNNSNIFNKYFSRINGYINRSLFEVYKLGVTSIPNSLDKIPLIVSKFYTVFGNKAEEFFVFFVYFFRVIIVISFLIDVFYFFKFDYFYKFLTLLCIPIFVNILFFIITDYANNLEELNSLLIITNSVEDEKSITEYRLRPGNENLDLKYLVDQYKLCFALNQYLKYYNMVLYFVSIRCNIVIYSLYLLGWLFILYKNVFLIVNLL